MSDNRGRGRGDRGGGRGRGGNRGEGGRGRGGGAMDLPFRPSGGGDFRGGRRGGRGDFQDRGRGGRGGRGGGRGRGGFSGPSIFRQGEPIPPPDANVEKTEETTAKELAVARKKSAGQPKYPDRPGYGTLGSPVTLYANYLPLKSVGKPLFRYHITIAPDGTRVPVGKKAQQIVRLLLEEHFPSNLNQVATDYRSTMVSCVELLKQDEQHFDVRYKNENDVEYPEGPKLKVFKVTCVRTGTINPADLINYLTSTNAGAMLESKHEILQALNLIMGHYPKTDNSIISVGANKHYSIQPSTMESRSLGGGLDVLRGFFISVRAATARVLLNVQVKYVACYQSGPLGTVIADWRQANRPNNNALANFLKTLRVRITHLERRNPSGKLKPRIKTIKGLATPADGRASDAPPKVANPGAGPRDVLFFLSAKGPGSSQSTPGSDGKSDGKSEGKGKKGKKTSPKAGPAPEGRYISVEQFFKQEYNITCDPQMPVVNCGTPDDPSYYPVEVCDVQSGQIFKSKISPNQTSNMLGFAVMGRRPAQNAESIVTNGVNMLRLGAQQNPTLSAFGVSVTPELLTVKGRILSAPKVYYARNKEVEPIGGSWNMRSISFSRGTQLKSWTYLYIAAPRSPNFWADSDALRASLKTFTDQLRLIGIDADYPKQGLSVTTTAPGDIEQAILSLQQQHQPMLILGIFPSKDIALYNSVKQICDVRCGVRNVNVQADKLVNPNPQYSANVGLKINLKLGGANQALRQSDLGFFADGKTMLVGIDVTHPSPGSTSSAPSVAGIVASIDASLAQWPAEIRIQPARQEMVADLDNLLCSRIKLWAKHNKNMYPENIVVYRDGVSDGQYDTVIDSELPLLKKACEAVYPASDTKKGLPRMAIVVVGKRHNTRFYPTNEHDADRANPKPGTVVDRGVTEARNWDFYLQAHSALQGTARPAHYFTVWDEIFYPRHPAGSGGPGAADVLQDLTHKMCYLFGRATKAVSVCPPAYYADLVCTRARCYLSDLFDPSPAATTAGSAVGTEGGGKVPDRSTVVIHPNVADSMFYI